MTRVIKLALAFVAASALTALSSQAQSDDGAAPKEAPQYFIDGIFEATTAETLANFCPDVQLNIQQAQAQAEYLLTRLSEDGFGDVSQFVSLDGIDGGVLELQSQYMEDKGLTGADQARVCAVAQTEIDDQSAIGAYLVRVSE